MGLNNLELKNEVYVKYVLPKKMYTIDQNLANEIAIGPMKYWLMKILFEATEEEAENIEDMISEDVGQKYSRNVARAIMISLPLLLEHEAISNYINKYKRYELGMMLPEVLSPEEGVYIARGDIMDMSDNEFNETIETLTYYQKTLSRIIPKRGLQLSIPFELERLLIQKINNARARRILERRLK